MTEQFGQKALDFYGIDTAPIVGVEPTDLPVIDVNDSLMDFVFLLEDDSYLHLEQYRARAIYMKGYDGDVIFDRLANKIHNRELLTDEEQLQLIFLPLMHTKKTREELATDVVELTHQLEDENKRFRLIGATVGIGDKYLDDSYVEKMLEVLKMTRIAERLYKDGKEEGKQEAILTYLETRFELKSADIQNKVINITDINALNKLIVKLYQAETETQAVQLIDEHSQ